MAKLELDNMLDVPYLTDIECPACSNKVHIVAEVEVKADSINFTGSSGFNSPNFSVSLNTTIKKFKIHHECEYSTKEKK